MARSCAASPTAQPMPRGSPSASCKGNPDPFHPLRGRVILIALAVLETQVLAADAAEARLLKPLPELVTPYEARGYRRVADRTDLDYLRKERGLL